MNKDHRIALAGLHVVEPQAIHIDEAAWHAGGFLVEVLEAPDGPLGVEVEPGECEREEEQPASNAHDGTSLPARRAERTRSIALASCQPVPLA